MRRRGFVILEVIVACGLLAVLLTMSVQVLSLMAVERRHVERRAIALVEAANIVERMSTMPYEDIDEARLADVGLSPDVCQLLPDGRASLAVEDESGEVPGKRVRVEIVWTGAAGHPESPVRLTHWVWQRPSGDELTGDELTGDELTGEQLTGEQPTGERP